MGVLPDDYEVPTADTGYMKWEQGENKFRILSEIITGEEAWNTVKDDEGNEKRVPLRFKSGQQIPVEDIDEPDKIRHFWAMVVWNYGAKRIQILEITQKTIQKVLRSLDKSDEWGDLRNYDIKVFRTGETRNDTEYEVVPVPPKPLDKEVKKAYEELSINLEALFDGEDPFGSDDFDIPEEPED